MRAPQSQPDPNPQQLLHRLYTLSQEFTAAAQHDQLVADTLSQASRALEEAQAENRALKARLDELDPEKLSIYIDGSGSMSMPADKYAKGSKAEAALKAAQFVRHLPRERVETLMWSGEQVVAVTAENRDSLKQGLMNSSDIKATVAHMQQVTSSSKRAQHFVIISDGDLFGDEKDVAKSLKAVLDTNPGNTIDFLVVADRFKPSPLETLARTLKDSAPNRVSCLVESATALPTVLDNLVTTRFYPPKPPQYTMSLK